MQTSTYIRGWRCAHCGTDHIEPQPNLFRYNSPLGACPVCEGLGRTIELDLGRIVPDRRGRSAQGALAPWSTPAVSGLSAKIWWMLPAKLDIPVDVPFDRLTGDQVQRLLRRSARQGIRRVERLLRGSRRRSYKSRRPRHFWPDGVAINRARAATGPGSGPKRWPSRSRATTSRSLGPDNPRSAAGFVGGLRRPRGQAAAPSILAQLEAASATWRNRARLPDPRPSGANALARANFSALL